MFNISPIFKCFFIGAVSLFLLSSAGQFLTGDQAKSETIEAAALDKGESRKRVHRSGSRYGRQAQSADIHIKITQYMTQDAEPGLAVVLDLARAQTSLDFGPILPPDPRLSSQNSQSSLRMQQWQLTDKAFVLEENKERLILKRANGRPFTSVSFRATGTLPTIDTNYRPATTLRGETTSSVGTIIYTGHFHPHAPAHIPPHTPPHTQGKTSRMQAEWSLTPLYNGYVMMPGDNGIELAAGAVKRRKQGVNHPAFVYLGTIKPQKGRLWSGIVEPQVPDWVRERIQSLVDRSITHLDKMLGPIPGGMPMVIVGMGERASTHRDLYRYSGDALPGQIMTVLDGAAWSAVATDHATGRDILARASVHEVVHLWQSVMRPADGDVPAWIHEGAAEAIAGETLVALGIWDLRDLKRFYQKARRDCASGLKGRQLSRLSKARNFRTVYACGHVLAVLAASGYSGQSGLPDPAYPVTAFWRDYLEEGRKRGRVYSLDTWLSFSESRVTNRELNRSLRAFVRTSWHDPATEISRLQGLSGHASLPAR